MFEAEPILKCAKQKGGQTALGFWDLIRALQDLKVLRDSLPAAVFEIKCDQLAFSQRLNTGTLQRIFIDENFFSVLRFDGAEAPTNIKPFYVSM
ncbi:putative regulator [Roseibium sp. TrichSKD4]|nr:putative regulator [Roseibium sp. TrichSKD4]